jgi:hypothetical protein
MRRLFILCLVLAPTLAPFAATASGDQCCVDCLPKLMNAQMVQDLASVTPKVDACTTYVGYNPAYAASNYWSIGVGNRRPRGAFGPSKGDIPPVPNQDTGYWDWDHPVHGDSLQGWWPVRHRYECTGGCEIADSQRPWWAIDIGNQANYVINQGSPYRRTMGVVGVWHSDPGPVMAAAIPGTNPVAPAWAPLVALRSAWCGLRAHGDVTVVDPITGNPFNVAAMEHTKQNASSAGGTDRKYPGYASQWDQMLYRDVDISAAPPGAPVTLTFDVATSMSTNFSKDPRTRAGWFEWDPLAVIPGNYVPAATPPIDRFNVYIGKPVEPAPGFNDDFMGSDGLMHDIFDPMRRWFSEVLDISVPGPGGTFKEVMSLTGVTPAGPVVIVIPAVDRAGMGPKLRIVFRVKTNRGFDDDGGSLCAYSSGGMGAAQIDAVTIAFGFGPMSLGGFENPGDIDNSLSVSALHAWKSTGKPPGIYPHVDDLSNLIYQDVCGPPGVASRRCNMAGNVISAGDHDLGEAAGGALGTAEQDRMDAIYSPTISLVTPANPGVANAMGISGGMLAALEDFRIAYESYTGAYDLPYGGNAWQFFFQSYPATQSDGVRCWGEFRVPDFIYFNPAKQCVDFSDPARMWGLIRTSNATGIPDSLRIGLRKIQQCWRFEVTNECSTTLGAYWDNVSLAILGCDTNPCGPVSVDIWHWIQDAFPADETAPVALPAFFRKAARVETGLNTAPGTCNPASPRCDDPGDFPIVTAEGPGVRVDMVFRILPGPGSYLVAGVRGSGLLPVPTAAGVIVPGDGSFWSAYIADNGPFGTPGGHPAGPHATRWSEFVWNSARCDTAECFCGLFPVQGNGLGCGVQLGKFAATYHEADPKFATLGIRKNRCFLIDPDGPNSSCGSDGSNVVCGNPPAWVLAPGTGYNDSTTTRECSKIIPDDLLPPGAHVEYFFKRTEIGTGCSADVPDTSRVIPQWGEGPSTDAHRWQQFSVLPDAWKEASFGGLGRACMLYIDSDDRRGNERVWDGVADSIGATRPAKQGAHNGWQAPVKIVNPNNPAWFAYKNEQPGTTWDMYGVKAAESLNANSGSLGARLAFRPPPLSPPCEARNAPTLAMLDAFYRVLLIHSGDISRVIVSPFIDRSQDDFSILHDFLFGGVASAHRGLWVTGEGFAASADADGDAALLGLMSVSLREDSYYRFSGNDHACIDLIPTAPITTNGDIYGIRNTCVQSHDVLNPEGDGVVASYYDPVGVYPWNAPYVSGVLTDAEPPGGPARHFQTLLDGWDVENQLSRLCDKPYGRLAYSWNVLTNVFGKICSIAGTGSLTTEVPSNDDGALFADLARLGDNPVLHGSAVIHLTLARPDRVTVRIHDVSGRLVRTLTDGQRFGAGRVDPALTWDGLDDRGRKVARGAYFVSVRYETSRYEASRKLILLK